MEEKDLDRVTATKLREIAKQYEGITGTHAMKKEELIIAIRRARGEDVTSGGSGSLSARIGTVKERMKNLRTEQETARESKDRKKVDILRRRIKRCRRLSRNMARSK